MKKLIISAAILIAGSLHAFASGHVATATATNVSCNGLCNGSATGYASGGIGPYGYSWAGPSGYTASTQSISGLCAGSYTVTAVDSADMSTAAYTISITQPTLLTVSITGGGTFCSGALFFLNAVPSGGTAPYAYSWTPSASLSCPTCAGTSGPALGTTTYMVVVTDSHGCTASAFSTVTVTPSPVVTVNSATICSGQTAVLTAAGAMTYTWSPGGATNPLNVTPATTTSYTVTGNTGGCVGTALATVTVNVSPAIVVTPNPASCGACNGSISNTTTGAMSYSWTGPAAYTSTIASPSALCPGTYTVTATSGAGCAGNQSVNVGYVTVPSVTVSTTNASCGACDGSATATATGGAPPYSYSWSPMSATTPTLSGLCAGTYSVTVTDAFGCPANSFAVVSNNSGPVSAAVSVTNTSCSASTGAINIGTVTGGVPPYQYSLNGGAFTSATSYTGLGTGIFTVGIKDVNGCIINLLDTVGYLNPPVIALDSLNGISCIAGTSGYIYVSVTGGTPAFSYSWSNGATSEDLPSVTTYGNYTLTVSDAAGCNVSHTYFLSSSISVYGIAASTPVHCSSMGTATATGLGGAMPFSYLWNTLPVQTTPTATGLTAGTYTCIVTDATGCTGNVVTGVSDLGCDNVVKGRVYRDLNGNCIQDAGENGFGGVIVSASGYSVGVTDVLGDYTLTTPSMTPTISLSAAAAAGVTFTCPASGSIPVTFATAGDTSSNNNFGLLTPPGTFNLGIHPGWSSASPGFSKQYWIYPINNSLSSQLVTMRFVYDSNLVYTACTAGGVHDPATRTITWNRTLAPGGYSLLWGDRVDAFFSVPATMSITSTLSSYFEILPMTGDTYPIDNTLMQTEPVTGSRDPNSKSVIPAGTGPMGDIYQTDSVLFYTIHFQNNGNDTAHFVVVTDTLSPYLDPSTVVPGAADHPYTFDISGEGIMTFRFDNIMLPDSTTDEPASNGYFNYTVHQRAGNPIGSVITNTANIYFDFNDAVVTNTTSNRLIALTTEVTASSINNEVKVFPNPFANTTHFEISNRSLAPYRFELIDVLGKKVKQIGNITSQNFDLSREGLQNGIYFYKIFSNEEVIGIGKVIIK
ncbi:MAG: T9SS type A sorting domain-containing protein [Bacteroidia bacterium]